MKIKHLGLLSATCAALFLMSCGSTPKKEPDLDFDPTEKVEEKKEEVKEEVKETVPEADFEEANKLLLDAVEKARKAAIDAGAQKYFPEQFDQADKWYIEVKEKAEKEPKADHSAAIKDAAERFTSLAKASLARSMKDRADELGFAGEDQAAYDKGAKALEEYAALGSDASGSAMLAKADEAFNAYTSLMLKGFMAYAGRERNAALEAKKNADSVKAGVAKKEEYTKASETFKAADKSFVTKDIEGAFRGYKSSKEAFTELFETVSRNRAAAQAAIERAKAKVAEAENYSTEADTISPLTGEVAGIEKEDAVLLEEDKLSNPDDAVINVEDDVTAKAAEKAAAAAIAVEKAVN